MCIRDRFCADCGHVMYQQRYQNKNRKQDCYICGSYKKRTRDCTAHFIRTDLLTAGVLSNLRQVTEYAAKHESRFVTVSYTHLVAAADVTVLLAGFVLIPLLVHHMAAVGAEQHTGEQPHFIIAVRAFALLA